MYEKAEQVGENPTMKNIEEKVVTVFDHLEKGLEVVLDEVTDRVWKTSEPNMNSYLEIVNSPFHTYDRINSDQRYQQIKIEAMNMVKKNIEKGGLLEEKSSNQMAEGYMDKSKKESPKFQKQHGKKMGKQIELGERTY